MGPIEKLSNEVIMCIAEAMDTPDQRSDLVNFSMVSRRFRDFVAPVILRDVWLLRKRPRELHSTTRLCAALSQVQHPDHPDHLIECLRRPPEVFKHVRNFKVHRFFNEEIEIDLSEEIPPLIVKLLLRPTMLRSLDIGFIGDGADVFKWTLDNSEAAHELDLASVKELRISTCMWFIMKYTPNLRLLSSVPTCLDGDASGGARFLSYCKDLQFLTRLELSVTNDMPDPVNWPRLPQTLTTMEISTKSPQCLPENYVGADEIDMPTIVAAMRSQPQVLHWILPPRGLISMDPHWVVDNLYLAKWHISSFLFEKCPDIMSISFRDTFGHAPRKFVAHLHTQSDLVVIRSIARETFVDCDGVEVLKWKWRVSMTPSRPEDYENFQGAPTLLKQPDDEEIYPEEFQLHPDEETYPRQFKSLPLVLFPDGFSRDYILVNRNSLDVFDE
ncbi:hypothetical protein HDK77DRAFT_481855 [Phyllosticta capitalensis]